MKTRMGCATVCVMLVLCLAKYVEADFEIITTLGNSAARSIDGEFVVGNYGLFQHGFRYNMNTKVMETIDVVIDGVKATTVDIAGIDGDNLVGWCILGSKEYSCFYNGSEWSKLPIPAASSTNAYGIDGSKIVGAYDAPYHEFFGYIYDFVSGEFTKLDNGVDSYAFDIDLNSGIVVGALGQDDTDQYGWIYDISEEKFDPFHDRSLYPNATSYGTDGENIVGITEGAGYHGFLYNMASTQWTILDPPDGYTLIFPRDIDNGHIVGDIYNGSTWRGFIYTFDQPDPDIDVSPVSYDFGDVEIGSSTTTFVSLYNAGDGNLTVESLGFSPGSSSNFSITTAPSLPATVVPGGTVDVEITFAPSAVYYSSAVLEIGSDDPDESLVIVDLSGVGVVIEIPPSEQVQEIITFIEDSVSDGDLAGEGPGSSADKKLNAMINMIEAVGNLISDGLYEEAKQQLEDILKKCDGESPPPDFVTGPAATDLAEQIQGLMQIIKGAVVVTVDGISPESTLWGLLGISWSGDDEEHYLGTALAATGVEAYNVELVNFTWSRDPGLPPFGDTGQAIVSLREELRHWHDYADDKDKKFIVIAHSWGTFLSYRALSDLSQDVNPVRCDLYVTLSSPLGTYAAHEGELYPVEELVDLFVYSWALMFADWTTDPLTDRHVNYWAWGDVMSGPLDSFSGGDVEDQIVDYSEGHFGDPGHRNAITTLGMIGETGWHQFTSLQAGGTIDNSAFRRGVADLIMQTLRE